MSVSQLQHKLENGSFAVTGETGLPKGTNVTQCLHRAENHLKGRCDAVNVTDNQSATMRTGSLATCRLLMDRGMEPVFQMVCRDRNLIALQSDVLSVYTLGIRNILALTGAQFFQTQAVYDIKQFETFMKQVEKLNVPVLAGQVILKSAGMARFLNANVSGINVPEHLISKLAKDKEAAKSGQTGARICADFVKEAKATCQGVHLMTLGWDHLVPDIFEMADLG